MFVTELQLFLFNIMQFGDKEQFTVFNALVAADKTKVILSTSADFKAALTEPDNTNDNCAIFLTTGFT